MIVSYDIQKINLEIVMNIENFLSKSEQIY